MSLQFNIKIKYKQNKHLIWVAKRSENNDTLKPITKVLKNN